MIMGIKNIMKYIFRFLFLQSVISSLTIYYFDNFLLPKGICESCPEKSFRLQIDAYLVEDRNRFFNFLSDDFVKIDIYLAIFIFVFLIVLYSTKFYTYVNELSFSLNRNYFDEYLNIYLLWTASLVLFFTMFRFSNLISRGYLLIFTFIVPFILLIFRNSEFLSSVIGRKVTDENYITFNLDSNSIFNNLRIMTFRSELKRVNLDNFNDSTEVIETIDNINKENNVNLIVFNFENKNSIQPELENYLINMNKKILIISQNPIVFNNVFINRTEKINDYFLTYFNNDIQYGSKYIIKRLLDTFLSLLGIIIFSPLFLIISLYIYFLDGGPPVIKQRRVGLHGKQFNMYKFRTMKKGSHGLRDELKSLNTQGGPLFKIENDPRILKGASVLRQYSLDEIPQFFNVLKGEMSIVGPRPLFDDDTKLFDRNYMRRLNVLPGITGLLQINERNSSDFSTWHKYDMEYIDNWSLYRDIEIIIRTPLSLFKSDIKGK